MLSPDLLSVDEWAHRLASAECPMPPEPETEAKRTIACVVAWRPDGPTQGLFTLTPKPGTVWSTLDEVRDWNEQPIVDAGEARGFSGYVEQAQTGYPPYREPPVILEGGLQVFLHRTRLDPEWEDYNDASSAYGITRLWWEDQLVKAVNAGALKACDAAKALIKCQTVPPSRAYVRSDHLAAWLVEHQPFKDVAVVFANLNPPNHPQLPESPTIAVQTRASVHRDFNGLPSSAIVRLFSSPDVGKMGYSEWKDAFNDPPKWLKLAKRKNGTRGNNAQEALWCPLVIAQALVWGPGPQYKSRLLYTQVTRIFDQSEELGPYRDAWLALAPQREAMG
jgi:hypothetical protein